MCSFQKYSAFANMTAKTANTKQGAKMLSVSKMHEFFVTEYESSEDDREEFENSYNDVESDYDTSHVNLAKSIFKIFLEDWMYGYRTIYTKTHYQPLLSRILDFVSKGKIINILLPGFPGKSPNDEKVLGMHADFAEYLALRTFITTARKIEAIYPKGLMITILADNQTYDIGCKITDEANEIYHNDLQEMITNVGADGIFKLITLAEAPAFQEDATKLKLEYIRLSIHHHHPKTAKFPIDLYKKHNCNKSVLRTPWRHVIMYDTMNGEFIIDHKSRLLSSSERSSPVFSVKYQGIDWFLLKLNYSDANITPDEKDIQITMNRCGCGIIIENKSTNKLKSSVIHSNSLTSMIKEFGVVILRGFQTFQDEDDITNFYSARGSLGLVQWKCGSGYYPGFKEILGHCNETGGSSIHWDLMLPPYYMDISQSAYTYDESTCTEFMLYSRVNSGMDDATTFVDAHGAILALRGDLKEKWKKTVLVYEKKTHHQQCNGMCTGNKRLLVEYPLIQSCPWTERDVLRWAEMYNCIEHSSGNNEKHVQSYTIKAGSKMAMSPKDLEEEIKKVTCDERFLFRHHYQEGDQVFVNNYTMLHGTTGFQNDRELWKLHLVPSSHNIPDYYQNI